MIFRPPLNPLGLPHFEKLRAGGNLPSPKGVALAIMRLTQKEDASMAELARIIKSDPAFVGRLIKAANSVNVCPGRSVVSVQEALVVLGMPAVRNLALGFSLLSHYKQGPCKAFDYPAFWAASLASGIALQALALRTRAAPAEEAFSVGLLARVGELALATLYPEEYASVLGTAAAGGTAGLAGLEEDKFALNHRELAAAMLADWGVPDIFCEVVRDHERCDEAAFRKGGREHDLLHSLALARLIAELCLAGEAARAALLPRLAELGGRLSLGLEDLQALCERVMREWREWASVLDLAVPEAAAFGDLAAPAPEPAGQAPDDGQPRRLRVLVADDRRGNRAAVRAALEEAGYEVFEAADGEEGLRLAVEVQPQVLVTARAMPALDGIGLTRLLRATRPGRGMYILMLASQDGEEQLAEGFETGVDDYLAMPLSRRLLVARLRAGQRVVHLHQELEHEREELRRFAAELAITNRRLQEAALTDVLTGLPNRRYAMERIQQEWAASSRSHRPLACVVIDLDRFKEVNDSYGHDAGDAYLQQVAAAIRGALRVQDVVCRTGGDEFLAICPDTSLQAALACAERMRCAAEQVAITVGSQRLRACLSAGVAVREASMADVDALIKRADEGAYLAKQQGRNRVASPQLCASC